MKDLLVSDPSESISSTLISSCGKFLKHASKFPKILVKANNFAYSMLCTIYVCMLTGQQNLLMFNKKVKFYKKIVAKIIAGVVNYNLVLSLAHHRLHEMVRFIQLAEV